MTPVTNNTKRSLLLAPTILPLSEFGSVSQVQPLSMVRLQICRSAGDVKSVTSVKSVVHNTATPAGESETSLLLT